MPTEGMALVEGTQSINCTIGRGAVSDWLATRLCFPSVTLFCTIVHTFPQWKPLAKPKGEVYAARQIEPRSLRNFAAQLKEGATAEGLMRP